MEEQSRIGMFLDWKSANVERASRRMLIPGNSTAFPRFSTGEKMKAEINNGKVTGIRGGLPAALEIAKREKGYEHNFVRTLKNRNFQLDAFTEAKRVAMATLDPDLRKEKLRNLNAKKNQVKRDRRLEKKHAQIQKKKSAMSNRDEQNAESIDMTPSLYKQFKIVIKK